MKIVADAIGSVEEPSVHIEAKLSLKLPIGRTKKAWQANLSEYTVDIDEMECRSDTASLVKMTWAIKYLVRNTLAAPLGEAVVRYGFPLLSFVAAGAPLNVSVDFEVLGHKMEDIMLDLFQSPMSRWIQEQLGLDEKQIEPFIALYRSIGTAVGLPTLCLDSLMRHCRMYYLFGKPNVI